MTIDEEQRLEELRARKFTKKEQKKFNELSQKRLSPYEEQQLDAFLKRRFTKREEEQFKKLCEKMLTQEEEKERDKLSKKKKKEIKAANKLYKQADACKEELLKRWHIELPAK